MIDNNLYFFALAAGEAFSTVAKLQLNQLQSKHEAASQYVEAANCYRKADFQGLCCLKIKSKKILNEN